MIYLYIIIYDMSIIFYDIFIYFKGFFMNISELIDRIKTIRPLKDLESIELAQNTINNWKFRNTYPKADDLYKIAQFLNVTMEWLLTGEDKINNLSGSEQALLENYRSLDDKTKNNVDLMVEALTGN